MLLYLYLQQAYITQCSLSYTHDGVSDTKECSFGAEVKTVTLLVFHDPFLSIFLFLFFSFFFAQEQIRRGGRLAYEQHQLSCLLTLLPSKKTLQDLLGMVVFITT